MSALREQRRERRRVCTQSVLESGKGKGEAKARRKRLAVTAVGSGWGGEEREMACGRGQNGRVIRRDVRSGGGWEGEVERGEGGRGERKGDGRGGRATRWK